MLSLDLTQAALVAAEYKNARWAFHIVDVNGVTYGYATDAIGAAEWDADAWNTGNQWDDGENLSSIIIMDFNGIELRRNMAENTVIAPSDVTFSISNPDNTLTFSDFKGGSVWIELFLYNPDYGEQKIAGWKFRIKTSEPGYQKIRITAKDFLHHYLQGDYPNTRLPEDIFPSNRSYPNQGTCIPVPFGAAYVPLRDVYIDGTVSVTAITIAAVASASGARCKFTDSADGLGGIEAGRYVTVSGFTETANNGTFRVLSVAAGEIEIDKDEGLIDEAEGDSVTISHGSGYIMLGDPAYTYTISRVHSPQAAGQESEYLSSSYTFTQYTKADADAVDWRVFQAITADIDNDGTGDAPGFWMTLPNGPVLDPVVRFKRSDTATLTNPADVIDFVLKDKGVPSASIDAVSFATAKATCAGWGLTYKGAYWYKQPRDKVLAQLLTMCHSCLQVGEKVELHVLSKTSQKTITAAEVLRHQEQGEGTFSYRDLANEDYSDSGFVTWQETGKPQDRFLKVLVPAGVSSTVISKEFLECPFVQDSQNVQRIGTLHYQRKLLKEAEVNFETKGTCLALQPDDVITINQANYGGSYTVLVDSVRIRKDISIQFYCSKFTAALDDWEDLTPTALTIPEDDTAYAWQPTISGPQTDKDIARSAFDTWGKEYLTVGPTTNAGRFIDIQKAMNQVKQAGGGALYILNGTYALTAPLYVPNVNLEIIGQSQGGVIIQNNPGDPLFYFGDLTKSYRLYAFTIDSQNVASYDNMIHTQGTAAANNTAKINIRYVTMTLADDGSHNGSGDYGVYATVGSGDVSASDLTITGGKYGCCAESYSGTVDFSKNILSSQVRAGIFGSDLTLLKAHDNIIRDFLYSAIYAISQIDYCEMIRNQAFSRDDNLVGCLLYGVVSGGTYSQVINNIVSIISGRTGASAVLGISGVGAYSKYARNTIVIEIVSTSEISGLGLNAATDCEVSHNTVKLSNTNTTNYHYGLEFVDGIRNIANGNSLDLVNNDAKDVGIYLDAGSGNNQGSDNITYRVGTSVSDAGTGNAVTAKDV